MFTPLYYLADGSHVLAFIIASVGITVAIGLMWTSKVRASAWTFAGSFGMLLVAADMTRVAYTEPTLVSVEDRGTLSLDSEPSTMLIWAHPSDITTAFSVFVSLGLAYLVYRNLRARKLMTSATLVLGIIASVAVVVNIISSRFFTLGTSAWNGAAVVERAIWNVLLICLGAYLILAGAVFITRGIKRIRNRAQIDTLSGAGMVQETTLR